MLHKYLVVYICDGKYYTHKAEGRNKQDALDDWYWNINDGEVLNIIRLDEE